MKEFQEVLKKAKDLLAEAERRKEENLQEIEKAEAEKEKAIKEAEQSTKEGDTAGYSKAKAEAEALQERISFLQKGASFADMEKEINELQERVKEISRKANRKVFDIYYRAWIEAGKAEAEATKVCNNGNWILIQTDKLLNREFSDRVSDSLFSGMLKPSEEKVKYVPAWSSMRERRRKEKSQK